MRALSHVASRYWWAPPTLLVLGLGAALADGISVSLVVLFLYTLIGKADDALLSGGIVSQVFQTARDLGGKGSTALGLLIFAVVLAKTVLNMAYGLVTTTVKNGISEDMRLRVHAQYLAISYDYIQRHEYADMLNVLAKESWSIPDAYYIVTRIAINICGIAVLGTFLLAVSWQLTAIAIAGSSIIFFLTQRFAGPLRRLYEKAITLNNELGHRMLTTLQGMRTIRAFAREEYDRARFQKASMAVRKSFVRMGWSHSFVGPIGDIGHLAVLGLIAASAGALGIGASAALAAIALLYRLQPQVQELQGNWLNLATMDPSLRVVRGVIDTRDKQYLPEGSKPFEGLKQEIAFEAVSFTYPGAHKPALDKVSFAIPRGLTVAIVGPSGCGKTTIVNLLLRLYWPDSGLITVDGTPLFELRRTQWLGKLAVAGQDVELIDGTIDENITIGRDELAVRGKREAATAAGILDFIEQTESGFDTWVGERGLNISGGQRQRIGLARALFGNPETLILDEATSALDGSLEAEVRGNIGRYSKGKTLILITHRLETVLLADHVVCIEDGRVVEQGVPAILAQRPGSIFRTMLDREHVGASDPAAAAMGSASAE
jgi:ABC-type multidrug transport system fused ATPase/permease subunit